MVKFQRNSNLEIKMNTKVKRIRVNKEDICWGKICQNTCITYIIPQIHDKDKWFEKNLYFFE